MTTDPDRLCQELQFVLAHADEKLRWAIMEYIEFTYAGMLLFLDTQGPVDPKEYSAELT